MTTIKNGATLRIFAGLGEEGDGIDSNGWLVIDGGSVTASACATSGDAGIDADKGVYIRGGRVIATGNMLDRFEAAQTSVLFTFNTRQPGGQTFALKQGDKTVISATPVNAFQYLILSCPELTEGIYQLYQGETKLFGIAGAMQGGPGGMQPPEGMDRPDKSEAMTPPGGMNPPEKPEDMERPQAPEGMTPPGGFQQPGNSQQPAGEATAEFTFVKGYNAFTITGTTDQ